MALLTYDFRTIHENVVHTALASIERRVASHNARMRREFGGGARATTSSPTVAASRARATTDAISRNEQRAAAQATLYWQKAAQRSADFRIRADDRAHRQRLAQIAKEERAQAGAAVALDRQRSRAVAAQFRAVERHAMNERKERGRIARGLLGAGGRSVAGTLGAVGGYGAAALGIAGTFAVGSAIQTQLSEGALASNLANQAGKPGMKGELLREAQAVKGFTGSEALGGLGAFVEKTGNLEAARGVMGDLSELALATGANLEDLGRTAGQAFNVLKGQGGSAAEVMNQVKELMPVLAAQGRLGAVEIKDLATEFGKLGAASRGFEGGAPGLLRSMGAFAQIAVEKGGAQGSADAATAAARLAGDIVTNRKKFEGLGVGIQSKTDKTKLRAPEEIMLDVLSKTGGDITKTSGLFGMESKKIFSGMAATFSEAEGVKKGSGREAALAEFQRFAGAQINPAEIREQAASRLADPDLLIKENMKKFNAAIGTELVPVLTRLIPEFTKLIPHLAQAAQFFGKLVEGVAKDPWGSLIKILGAKLALDLASAGIGGAIRNKLMALMSGAGGGGISVPGGASAGGGFMGKPTMAGALGAAGIGLGIGTAVAAGISTAGVASIEKNEADIDVAGSLQARVQELAGASGPYDTRQSADLIAQLEGMSRNAQDTSPFEDFMGLFGASNAEVKQKSIDSALQTAKDAHAAAILKAQQEAGQQMLADTKAAGESFKVAVADAGKKMPPNRGNPPTSPVP